MAPTPEPGAEKAAAIEKAKELMTSTGKPAAVFSYAGRGVGKRGLHFAGSAYDRPPRGYHCRVVVSVTGLVREIEAGE